MVLSFYRISSFLFLRKKLTEITQILFFVNEINYEHIFFSKKFCYAKNHFPKPSPEFSSISADPGVGKLSQTNGPIRKQNEKNLRIF